MNEIRHLLSNTAGKIKSVMFSGREHLVVPVIALMEGVIHAVNASEKEFVPLATLSANVHQWNGRPVVLMHPVKNGIHIAANDPTVLDGQYIGTIFNTRIENKRLLMDAYIDPTRLEALGRADVVAKLRAGTVIEVSVGAMVATHSKPGEHNGKAYQTAWAALSSDHLAFLPDGRGACSVEMGCGAHRAASAASADVFAFDAEDLKALGGSSSGNFGHSGGEGGPGNPGGSSGGGHSMPKWMDPAAQTSLRKILDKGGEMKTVSAPSTKLDTLVEEMSKQGFKLFDAAPSDVPAEVVFVKRALAGAEECPRCKGSGAHGGNPCEACDGVGQLKAAETRQEDSMDRKVLISKLTSCACSGFTADDVKMLEAASDDRLTHFLSLAETAVEAAKTATEAAKTKAEADAEAEKLAKAKEARERAQAESDRNDKRSLEEKVEKLTTDLRASTERVLDEADFLKRAPASIRSLVADAKAKDEAEQTALITTLKVAAESIFSEAELKEMPLPALRKLAAIAKVDAPDYSARPIPRMRAAGENFAPPDAYAESIKALQASK